MPAGEAAEWHCGNCGGLNVDEDTACASCGASRPVEPFVARPRIDETDESDQRLLSWIARATLLVGATAAVYTAIALRGDCGNGLVRQAHQHSRERLKGLWRQHPVLEQPEKSGLDVRDGVASVSLAPRVEPRPCERLARSTTVS